MPWIGKWDGGRIFANGDGEQTYVIERMVRGERYAISTRRDNERDALAELALFKRNPAGYVSPVVETEAPKAPDAILLDKPLGTEFIDFSRDVLRLTPGWLQKKRKYLAWWTEKLWGVDLRRISLRLVLSKVPEGRTPARAHKLATLRALGAYLTDSDGRMSYKPERATMDPEENTLRAIVVPQSQPSQSKKKKRPVSVEHLKLVLENLTGQVHRDAIKLLLATGWHATELLYFVREGEIEPAPAEYRRTGTAAVLVTLHKKGATKRWKPTRVTAAALEAAERLKKHGPFDLQRLDKGLRAACRAAKITEFGPGQCRHIVESYAKAQGATDAQREGFMFHDARTANRHYAQLQSVERIPTPLDALG